MRKTVSFTMYKLNMQTLKIGDSVIWRGTWGADPPKEAVVTGIELTEGVREKYGHAVETVFWTTVRDNRVVVSLDNGHWAYGEQIKPIGAWQS